jgi:hypothetical protein
MIAYPQRIPDFLSHNFRELAEVVWKFINVLARFNHLPVGVGQIAEICTHITACEPRLEAVAILPVPLEIDLRGKHELATVHEIAYPHAINHNFRIVHRLGIEECLNRSLPVV